MNINKYSKEAAKSFIKFHGGKNPKTQELLDKIDQSEDETFSFDYMYQQLYEYGLTSIAKLTDNNLI